MSEEKKVKKVEKKDWRDEVLPKIKAGVTVKVHQKIKEKNTKGEEKERVQIFEGIVLGRRGGQGKTATVKVRKIAAGGIGVEKIFPLHSPNVSKIEIVKVAKVRRAKITYLRGYKKKLREKRV